MTESMLELSSKFTGEFEQNPDFDWFMALQGEVFRAAPGRRTLRFSVGSRYYFIKIHTGVGWKEIIKNLLQGKLPIIGARNEYEAIKRLPQLGVETMTLAAYGSQGWNPAALRSFVVTEALSNTVSLEELCQSWTIQPPPPKFKWKLIDTVAKIAKALHEHGVNHRDFYICHFLLQQNSANFHLYLIDLHRVQIRTKTPARWVLKDIAGLYFSSMDIGLTNRDRLRFMRSYRGRPLSKELESQKKFWQQVQVKAEKLYART